MGGRQAERQRYWQDAQLGEEGGGRAGGRPASGGEVSKSVVERKNVLAEGKRLAVWQLGWYWAEGRSWER